MNSPIRSGKRARGVVRPVIEAMESRVLASVTPSPLLVLAGPPGGVVAAPNLTLSLNGTLRGRYRHLLPVIPDTGQAYGLVGWGVVSGVGPVRVLGELHT